MKNFLTGNSGIDASVPRIDASFFSPDLYFSDASGAVASDAPAASNTSLAGMGATRAAFTPITTAEAGSNQAPVTAVRQAPAPLGTELLVNTATAGAQGTPQITVLAGGGFVITWTDASAGVGGASGDTSQRAVKAQVYAANGSRVGSELLVNTATAGTQDSQHIVALSNGGFVVTWQDNSLGVGGATGDSSLSAVKAQVYAADGSRIGTELLVNSATASSQVNGSVIALSNGGFAVTWTDASLGVGGTTGDTSGTAIKAQIYAGDGSRIGTELLVNTAVTGDQHFPQMVALSGGGFAVTWVDESLGVGGATGDTSGSAIKAQVFTASGSHVGAELLVNTATQNAQNGQQITALSNGGFVVTWQDASAGVGGATGDTSGLGVKAQIYAADGSRVGGELLVNTETLGDQYSEQITALSNGGFVVTWAAQTDGNVGDRSFDAVEAQIFAADGSRVGSQFQVNVNYPYYQNAEQITALTNGGFVVTWRDNTGDASVDAVKAQAFAADGTRLGDEMLVNTATSGNQNGAQVKSLPNGGFVVTWDDASMGVSGANGDSSAGAVKAQVFNFISGFSATEELGTSLKGRLVASDVDAGAGQVTATVHVAFGTITATAGTSGATLSGSGTDTLTISGTLAQINALLTTDHTSTLAYQVNSNTPPASTNLTFTVNDGGNTGSGGALSSTLTANIAIIAANDPPSGADATITGLEDAPITLTAATFGYADVDGNAFAGVKIAALPLHGVLTDNGVAVTAGQVVSLTDIAAGHLVFTPAANANGTGYASFTFQVQDDGGTASGGLDTDQSPNVVTINITPVNDAPIFTVPVFAQTRVSTNAAGAQANGGAAISGVFSPDGTKIGFASSDANLAPNQTNNQLAIFIKDLATGVVTVVSTNAAGQQGDFFSPTGPIFSADGTKVAFTSIADNLVPGADNMLGQAYVKDLTTGAITLVSATAAGVQGNKDSQNPVFSPDGTKVVFSSTATNLVTGDTNAGSDIFVETIATGAITRVSLNAAGSQVTGASITPTFSPDGTKILFASTSTALVAGDTNAVQDIFIKDLVSGAVTRVSTTASGLQATGGLSSAPVFSPDGTKVLFVSAATNLVAGDTNGVADIFVKDLVTGAFTLVSSTAAGAQATGGASSAPAFSPDGTKVAFLSAATNLVAGDTNGVADVFVKDLITGAITRISVSTAGVQGAAAASGTPMFSPDGTKVVFNSIASNLVAGDTNGGSDVFVATLGVIGAPAPSYVESGAPIAIVPGGTVADDNANFGGGSLTIALTAGTMAGDVLSLSGNGVTVASGTVSYNGTAIGTLSGSGASIAITFTSAATAAAVQAVAQAVNFANSGDDPGTTRTATFTLVDGGGTANGGHDTTVLTQTIAVSAINDAPTLTAAALSPTFTEADGIGAQAAAVALFSGTSASAVESDQSITGLTLTVSGLIDGASEHITIDGTTIALGSGSTGTTATNGLGYTVTLSGGTATIVLTSASGVSGAGINALVDGITYQDTNADTPGAGDRTVTLTQIHDNGGTANGGADTSSLAIASTVHVAAVNDAPVVDLNGSDPGIDATTTFTVPPPGGWKFTPFIGFAATVTDVDSADFNGGTLTFSFDADPGHPSFSQASDQLAIVDYGTTPDRVAVNGNVLSYNGTPFATFTGGTNGTDLVVTLTAGANAAEVQALIQQVDYDNTDSAPQTTDRHVGVTLTDGDGGTSVLATTTIHIQPAALPANQAPAGTDGTVTVAEDGAHTFAASEFGFTDGDGNALAAVEITTLPTAGTLTDNGTAVTAGQFVSAADIAAGHLVFTPAHDANGTGYASFTFQVQDDGGTANSGVDTDPTPRTLTLNVTAVDDAPVAVADTATTTEAATVVIMAIDNDTDVDGGPKAVATINGTTVALGDHVTLASGAVVTLNADGTLGYDPHGAFDYLTAQSSTVDHFSYTLNGGSTADVAVTVTGLTSAGDANHGGAGDDVVTGSGSFDLSQGGNDTVTGGAGNDAFYFGAAFTGADRVDGGGGTNDQIGLSGDYSGGNRLVLAADTLTNVEVIAAATGHSYDITTDDGNVTAGGTLKFFGSTLGAGDSFTVDGSAETDGKFLMYGGQGADHFTGGAGDDGFYFGRDGRFDPLTDHVDGGAGTNDQLALDGNYTVTISDAIVTNVEMLVLLDDSTPHNQYAITLSDDWTAAGQTHTVYGVTVRDGFTIDASAESNGNIKVYGGQGSDHITTGAGNDWIMGGAGTDTLDGGLGADTFFYNKVSDSIGSSHDTILNFDALHDHIDLPTAVTGIDAAVDHGALSTASFDADLTVALASLDAGHAVQFTADSGTLAGHIFEVIDTNGVAGYQAGQDMVIELQNPVNPITDTTSFL